MILKKDGSLIKKFSVVLCFSLVLNSFFVSRSYAAEGVVAQNPLFVPASAFVAAALIGSGMIAKNSQDAINAAGSLVDKILIQVKSSEVEKTEADPDYDSPFRVINGGQPEKPNGQNQNGKWVALAGGALASREIYANKDAIEDILRRAYDLGGYNQQTVSSGFISADKLNSTANMSNVSLQLANISNSALTQFDQFLHSETWLNQGVNADDCYFSVNVNLSDIFSANPLYPALYIRVYYNSNNVGGLNITKNLYEYGTYSNSYGSLNRYISNGQTNGIQFLNSDGVVMNMEAWSYTVYARYSNNPLQISGGKNSNTTYYNVTSTAFPSTTSAFCGYIGIAQNPIQFTNNIYNPQVSFDSNFTQWVQGQIQTLSGQIVDAVRLGLTSASITWNPNQQQIQEGLSPSSVIYQLINNYENPGNIPNDDPQPEPDPEPEPAPEPVPDNEYLGSFLLPETITTKFPFCIPFDVARCLRLFSTSQRAAPRWECDLGYGAATYHVVIDLSVFNDVADFIRPLEYILFLVGLAVGTRSLIRG